jgi:outer membrane protein with beta-barrel domain
MKRIYMIVAALLLLSIAGVDYYFTHRHATPDAQRNLAETNALPAGTATPGTTNTADALAETTPADDAAAAPAENSISTTAHHYRHHRRYAAAHRRKAHGDKSVNAYALAGSQSGDDDLKHEVSSDYFGNTRDKKSVVTNEPQYSYTIAKQDNTIYPRHKIHFGIEAGLNQNSLTDNHTPNVSTLGFHAGVIIDMALGNSFAFQPGLLYSRKGNRLQNTLDVNTQEKLQLHYIELPANLVWKIGDANNTRFLIGAGPYVSYLIGADDKFQTSPAEDVLGNIPSTANYQTNKLRKYDWGVGGFIGCEIPEGLYAKAGAEVGLRDMQQNTDGSWSNRNYNFLVSIGYILNYEK